MSDIQSTNRRRLIASAGASALFFASSARAQTGATRYGVIEIGASGVRASALSFSQSQLREPRGARERGATSGFDRFDRNVIGEFNDNPVVRERAQIQQTVQSVTDAVGRLGREHNVQRGNIHVVGSSSVDALPHRDELARALAARGVQIEYVSPRQEAELLARWIVPPSRWQTAIVADVGSGNTKGGFITGTAPSLTFQAFEIPFGSRSLAGRVDGQSGGAAGLTWNRALVSTARTLMDAPAQQCVETSPGLARRPRAYLVGGAPWAMCAVMHPGPSVDSSRWISLSHRDIAAFREAAFAGNAFDPQVNVGLGARLSTLAETDPEAEQRARALLSQVSDVISPGQMRAGAEILSILSRRFRFERKEGLFFSKEGLFAWPTMWLLQQTGLELR